MLRYRRGLRFTQIRRYYEDRPAQDLSQRLGTGVGPGELPRYLLIYGDPGAVPWEFQYLLNQACAVGRPTSPVSHSSATWKRLR